MNMNDKTIIITGANSGIGKAASIRFAQEGFTVVMACRSIEKANKVKDEIIASTKNEKIIVLEADMSSFASIRSFCEKSIHSFPKLDILIHNAAYFNHGEEHRLSADNIELTFATNVAGPFLMTGLLLDHLKKSDDPVILNASSNIIKHFFSPKKEIDFNNLIGKPDKNYNHSVYKSYRNSKMALLMLTFRMAEVYNDFGIRVNALQINGAKMSKETLKKFKPGWRMIARVQNLFFPPAELMANNYFEICASEKYGSDSGKLFNHKLEVMKPAPENTGIGIILGSDFFPAYAQREDVRDQVWQLCAELTKGYL
jgi:NAD(P)-dependent dehydrogenase (short-subunit alcohol dehydrogenase family)